MLSTTTSRQNFSDNNNVELKILSVSLHHMDQLEHKTRHCLIDTVLTERLSRSETIHSVEGAWHWLVNGRAMQVWDQSSVSRI